MSLFIYRLSVTELLSEKRIKEYNDLVRDFIWKSKRPKIALRTLQSNKTDGGLNVANLGTRDKSLKIQWVFQMDSDPMIKTLAFDILENPIGDLLWQAQLKKEDIKNITKKRKFWTDVLKCWCELNYAPPITKVQVLEQIIWLNSNICINNTPIIYIDWIKAKVIRIRDLLDGEANFLSIHQINQKWNCNLNFLALYGIIQAIPLPWKRWLRESSDGKNYHDWYKFLASRKSVAKICYQNLNANPSLLSQIIAKWENIPNLDLSIEKIEQAINRIYIITNVPKLRSFHYRLLLKAIITNIHLKHYKIKESDLCSFCHEQPETVTHLFYYCTIIRDLWRDITNWCKIQDLPITLEQVSLNTITPNAKLVQNLIVLLGKHYIYTTKCHNKTVSLINFKLYVHSIRRSEEEIARKNNNLPLHKLKWSVLDDNI